MSQHQAPDAPEEYPADVREALHQRGVTHEGNVRAAEEQPDPSDHLGAEEGEVTPVVPPMTGPDELIEGEDEADGIDPREELTGG